MDWLRLSASLKTLFPGLLLPLILAVALGLRLYGIDWDRGYGFHPDERSIYMQADCMYRVLAKASGYADCIRARPETEPGLPGFSTFLDADRSPLNPHWFPLGSILIYLIVAVRFVLEPFMDLGSLLNMSYIGRSIMVLADVGTVFMVYLLGQRVYGRRVGLLAAALVALAVVHIQHAHFYRPEPLLVFFLLVSFWFMLQMMERRRLRDSLLLGLFVGLAVAPKVSVLPLVLPLGLAYGYRLFTTSEGRWNVPAPKEATQVISHAFLAGVVAVVVFLFTMPYAFLDFADFIDETTWQAGAMARTAGTVPFTVQYIGSTPFLYELRQTSLWALGLPLGIVVWGGLLFTILRVALTPALRQTQGHPSPTSGRGARGEGRGELLFLAWVVPNFLLLGIFEVKFLRYIFPLIPFLILMGSGTLFWLLDRAKAVLSSPAPLPLPSATPLDPLLAKEDRGGLGGGTGARAEVVRGFLARYAPHAVIGLIAFVVAATAFYAFAFERVYARPHPAIQASLWINENIPRGATIVTDNHWDEGIPDIYSYGVRQIPIYEPDTTGKMDTIAGYLSQGDYLAFYSNRTYGSVGRLPERYPLSSRYYRLLFSGELGYELERAFTSYPQLLGVAFVDDTFTRAGLPEPEPLKISSPAPLSLNLGYADENVIDYDHPKVLLFKNVGSLSHSQLYDLLTKGLPGEVPRLGLTLSPEQKASQRQEGTWSEIIKRDSWTNRVPILAWLLLVELVYLATLPLATFLFRPLPDRGIILARPLGILGMCYVAWLLSSLGWMSFSRTSVLVGILVVAFLSALVLATRWRDFRGVIIGNWRLLAIGEVLFLAAFLSFVAIRMANPDLWHPYTGGEKPMDFAYLNAVLRSAYMPPYDPWFAGGYLNYYYWGQFIVATLIKATGIVPAIAYNLAIPLLFALTVMGAYSLVYNIVAGVHQPSPQASPPSTRPSVTLLPPVGEGKGMRVGPVIAGLLAGLFVAVMGNLDGLVQLVQGAWNSLADGGPFPAFDFWRSSRMIPPLEDVTPSALTFWLPDKVFPDPDMGHHITEFPFFSFLFADLHAHIIAIPFTLLAIGLAFSLLVGLRESRGWWLSFTLTALAVAVGSLWAINSWDYPTYMLLAVLLIGAGVYLRRGNPSLPLLGLFLALAAGMVLLSILAFLPFHANYHPFPTGLDVSKWRTPIHDYLGIHGLFFFLTVTFLLYLFRRRLKALLGSVFRPLLSAQGRAAFWDVPAATSNGLRGVSWTVVAGALGTVVIVYMAAAGYWTAVLLTFVLLLTGWAAKEVLGSTGKGAPYALMPLTLIALALLIGIGVEFVRMKDDIGRMNTLFKYYLEAWVLLSMASAYILWHLASRGTFRLKGISPGRGVWLAMLAILLAASFIYTILGTRDRIAERFDTQSMTLDGSDYMRTAVHFDGQPIELRWDYEAIRWLQDNVKGSPVILEAHNEQYHWSSRIADYTGLPTVLGWPWHQIQQRMRYEYAVRDRISDVREIYSTPDIERALELLRMYEVEYVVVGQLERLYYPAQGLEKFDLMAREGLARVVYQNEGTKIYQGLWYN